MMLYLQFLLKSNSTNFVKLAIIGDNLIISFSLSDNLRRLVSRKSFYRKKIHSVTNSSITTIFSIRLRLQILGLRPL